MKRTQRQFLHGTKRDGLTRMFFPPGKNSQGALLPVRRRVVQRPVQILSAGLLLLAALSVTLASGGADKFSSASGPLPQLFTSLNGPGNVFLTANVFGSGGTGTVFATVADFNGDGKLDYVTANQGNNTIGIALGNGDGTFKAPTSMTVACNPVSVAVGDFNGDGKMDLAVVDRGVSTDSVFFYMGNGDGTFQVPTSVSLGGLAASNQIVAADFNKDGHLDVAVSQINGSNVVVILGNGNGTFQAPRTVALPGQGWGVAVGDFNGDGIPDLVATSPAIGGVSNFLGKGDGNFTPVNNPISGTLPTANAFVPGGGPQSVAVGDFNKDGKLDIIAGLSGVNTAACVAVLLGNGDGTLKPEVLFGTADTPQSLAVGDFNGDGHLDWMASTGQINSADMGSITVGLGRGDGTFLATESYVAGTTPQWSAVADFNNDGKLDVVVPNSGSSSTSIFLGNGDGTLQSAVNISTPGLVPVIAVTGDFNNDGNADFVEFNNVGCPESVWAFLGKGDGTFQVPVNSSLGGSLCSGLIFMVAGDFNGDGKMDLGMLINTTTGPAVAIMLGNGDGTFQAPKITAAPGGRATWMSVGDLNKDGKLDAVVVQYQDNVLQIFLGNGDGTFQAPTTLATSRGPGSTVLGDFNEDGNLDLFVESQFDRNAEIFLGNGNGTFNAPSLIDIGSPSSPASVKQVGDFNLDGHLDIIFGHNDNRGIGISLLLGNGNGTFQTVQNYLVSGFSYVVAVADFNRDGAPDALLVDTSEEFISILLNQTPPPVNVSPGSLAFGNQLVGTISSTQPITVKNNGATATTIGVSVSGDFTQTNACPVSPATLAAGANCTVNVAFKPTTTGARNGTLMISYNFPGSPQTVSLSGTGVAPIVTLGASSVTFGNQIVGSSSSPQVVGLQNTGTATLTFTGAGITITGANAGDFSQTNTCGASVSAGANCSINVTFKPIATGARSASLSINDDATGSPQTVPLSGTGVAPVVSLSPTSLSFGSQPVGTSGAAQNVTLTNSGNAALTITSIAINGANSGDFAETNTCGASVAASANCSISVTFKPTATGNRAASVTITDDATGSPQAVSLTGTGTDFTIDVATGGSNTATVTAGQTATYNLQVTPVSGFNGTATLSCTGAPSEASCTPSPGSATPNGNTASAFAVNVTTTAPSILAPRGMPPRYPPMTWIRIVLPLVVALMLMVLLTRLTAATRGTKWAIAPAMVVLLGVLSWIGGCGGGGGGGVHNPGTPAGTYTLTVTGTSSGVSHTLKLTLKVN